MRRVVSTLGGLALLAIANGAHAEPTPVPPTDAALTNDRAASFRYTTAYDKYYYRAILEGIGVLGVGFMEYLVSTKHSRGKVEPAYDWTIFRDKLGGDAQSFDINRFNTNFVGHPIGGSLYYTAARSNRLSVWEGFAWAFTGSLLWEYIGEITEKPSYNDMIVTSWAGIANGEVLNQLGGFFARGKKNTGNAVLGAFFALPRNAHDWIDGLEPERADSFDALGFPNDIWHRFELSLGARATTQQSSVAGPQQTYLDETLRLDAEVINLPDYGSAGHHARTFGDGNLASLHFDVGMSQGNLAEATFATRDTLAGYYARDARFDRAGRLRGDTGVVGFVVGFEYGTHDYDRDRAHPMDQWCSVTVGGVTAEYDHQQGPLRLRAKLDAGADFVGVRSYALGSYVAKYRPDQLPTVLRDQGYYFAGGPTVTSSIDASAWGFQLGGQLHISDWHAILGLDDDETKLTHDVPRNDRHMRLGGYLAYGFAHDHVRLAFDAAQLARWGSVAEIRESRRETMVSGSLGVVF